MEKFKFICSPDKCNGCLACLNSCMHQAIELYSDSLHFDIPVINNEKCVNCGACSKSCQVLNPLADFNEPKNCFALYAKDSDLHLKSASGGASAVLVREIIANGGVAYAVVMPNVTKVYHKRISNINEIEQTQGSKYVQSSIGYIYQSVKKDLLSGKMVLFTGTPCQVGGLMRYLKRKYDNLITVELVCHGVSSLGLLKDAVTTITSADLEHVSVTFRKKSKDKGIVYSIGIFEDGINVYQNDNDVFIKSFESSVTLRESCYSCKYAQPKRIADLTICDFWGLGELQNSCFNKHNGVSGILINTGKGNDFFRKCKSSFVYEERQVNELIQGNGATKHRNVRNLFRNYFLRYYKTGNFAFVAETVLKRDRQYKNILHWFHKFHMATLFIGFRKIIAPLDYKSNYYLSRICIKK